MPEEPEVDSDKLRETAAEEMEKHGERFLRINALTTAILAAFAAVAGALAALTRRRPIWFASLALGLAGIVLFGRQLV